MNALRSVVFNILFIFGSLFWSVALLWALPLPTPLCARIVGTIYGGYMTFIERWILGLKLELRGLEHLPPAPYIIAAKHQSAFETLKLPFMARFGFPCIIHKKELYFLPIWGWYLYGMGQIGIDRGDGPGALQSIIRGCKRAIKNGRSVIIFPQGTRVRVGASAPYKVGIAKAYRDLQVPLTPMALNSGVFWGKNAFFKKPGTVVFEFMPALPPGLPPLQAMEKMERLIEEKTNELIKEALQ